VDDTVARMLQEHDWPGNVGELETVIKRACILARGDVITTDEIGHTLAGEALPARQDVESALVRAVRTTLQERLVDSSGDETASAFHDIVDLVETTLGRRRWSLPTETAEGRWPPRCQPRDPAEEDARGLASCFGGRPARERIAPASARSTPIPRHRAREQERGDEQRDGADRQDQHTQTRVASVEHNPTQEESARGSGRLRREVPPTRAGDVPDPRRAGCGCSIPRAR
jgi:hypothetical protein